MNLIRLGILAVVIMTTVASLSAQAQVSQLQVSAVEGKTTVASSSTAPTQATPGVPLNINLNANQDVSAILARFQNLQVTGQWVETANRELKDVQMSINALQGQGSLSGDQKATLEELRSKETQLTSKVGLLTLFESKARTDLTKTVDDVRKGQSLAKQKEVADLVVKMSADQLNESKKELEKAQKAFDQLTAQINVPKQFTAQEKARLDGLLQKFTSGQDPLALRHVITTSEGRNYLESKYQEHAAQERVQIEAEVSRLDKVIANAESTIKSIDQHTAKGASPSELISFVKQLQKNGQAAVTPGPLDEGAARYILDSAKKSYLRDKEEFQNERDSTQSLITLRANFPGYIVEYNGPTADELLKRARAQEALNEVKAKVNSKTEAYENAKRDVEDLVKAISVAEKGIPKRNVASVPTTAPSGDDGTKVNLPATQVSPRPQTGTGQREPTTAPITLSPVHEPNGSRVQTSVTLTSRKE